MSEAAANVPTSERVRIPAGDAVLAATLLLPDCEGPYATIVEPVRLHVESERSRRAASHRRWLVDRFAVLVVHLRGTGDSTGAPVRDNESHDADLRAACQWVVEQPWSTGKVGIYGERDMGSAALHATTDTESPVAAVAAVYAGDNLYTDGRRFTGGVLRASAMLDEPLTALASDALPPAAEDTTDWQAEWTRRILEHEPIVLDRFRHLQPDDSWDAPSVALGPNGDGMRRMKKPVLMVSGWGAPGHDSADRTLWYMPGYRLIVGPWGGPDPASGRPGPRIDIDREVILHFHHHLRGGARPYKRRAQIFVREPWAPSPVTPQVGGRWVEADTWPPHNRRETPRRPKAEQDEVDDTDVGGDVGMTAIDSSFGLLPWAQPIDQRPDNARSITYDWLHVDDFHVVGNLDLTMELQSSTANGQLSLKICDVAPDGSSTLVTRSTIDLSHLGVWPSDPFGERGAEPSPLTPDEWRTVKVQFEATSWMLRKGHRLRLAIAGSDWPTCWPPRERFNLRVRRGSVRLVLWTFDDLPAARDEFQPSPVALDSSAMSLDGVEWTHEHDVLQRQTRVFLRRLDDIDDQFEGALGAGVDDPAQSWLHGRRLLAVERNGVRCEVEGVLMVRSDSENYFVEATVTGRLDGNDVASRTWTLQASRTGA
ncbi:MAG: CocE/NonD family hydrolase [Ilumatobacteraceae bacterium]|jgi:putative CocE/NonD family hydrolase